MRCNCVSDQNYKVIGLCDLKNKPIDITDTEPWIQISVPEILPIPCEKPDAESIDKIFVEAKIVSSRVIVTPPAENSDGTITEIINEEGTKLTGRKLAVEGILCQKIVYTSLTPQQSVHSAHFNIPFCTLIILDPETDPDVDTFCVDVCIEDVYATLLNPRKIFKNVTLFLKAKEKTITC